MSTFSIISSYSNDNLLPAKYTPKKKNQPFEHAHETDIGRIYAFYVNYIVGQVD